MSDLSQNFPQDQEKCLTHNDVQLRVTESITQFGSQQVQRRESSKFYHLKSDSGWDSYPQ